MRKRGLVVVMIVGLNVPWSVTSAEAKADNLPRLAGATLLMGYPPYSLTVTTGEATSKLETGGGDWYVTPSMSADGHLIASARVASGTFPGSRARPRLVVSIYSATNQRWANYKDLAVFDGSVSISPDGTKLACITRRLAGAPSRLSILDLRTGTVTTEQGLAGNVGPDLSWSPDGQRIAFDAVAERSTDGKSIPSLQAIYVLNIQTGTASRLAEGMSPSWSPSGEWIAFYNYSPGRDDVKSGWYATNANRVSVIRPDGSDQELLLTLRRNDSVRVAPVWSPDGKTVLLNKVRSDEKSTMDIYLLDFASQKLTRKFENVPPVYGWVLSR